MFSEHSTIRVALWLARRPQVRRMLFVGKVCSDSSPQKEQVPLNRCWKQYLCWMGNKHLLPGLLDLTNLPWYIDLHKSTRDRLKEIICSANMVNHLNLIIYGCILMSNSVDHCGRSKIHFACNWKCLWLGHAQFMHDAAPNPGAPATASCHEVELRSRSSAVTSPFFALVSRVH